MLAIRRLLKAENERRDNEPHDETYDDVYLKQIDSDGAEVERKVDKVRQ